METKYVLILGVLFAVLSVTAVQAYASAQPGIGHMGGGCQMNGMMNNMMNGNSARQHMNEPMNNGESCGQNMPAFAHNETQRCGT